MLALAGCLATAGLLFAVRPSFAQAAKALGQSLQAGDSAIHAAAADTAEKSSSFEFDIPSQSLASALDRYAVITGNPVLFPSKLAAGRSSSAVRGRLEAGAALELLLQGTGLAAEQLHEGGLNTFALKQLSAADVVEATARAEAKRHVSERYDALVQARVWEALCKDAHTAPGSYRALLRFRIDAQGRIRQPRLVSSTGDARRDSMLTDTLANVGIGQPPPADLMQPLTMLMLPQGKISGRLCPAEAR
ncbi:hypothetical protein DXT88_12050 [Herbaspirillum lusitanum]|uniref:STN domain-containing protein n=1 Tax=Herbaspirillum lusitanum TaxID=213312 RepID=UPI002238588E|nr:STN domain-containing protein [Herbaspirillum lusitanum]MCW5298904.1 hypothetical protein [Herbaspirillum lusitanum]